MNVESLSHSKRKFGTVAIVAMMMAIILIFVGVTFFSHNSAKADVGQPPVEVVWGDISDLKGIFFDPQSGLYCYITKTGDISCACPCPKGQKCEEKEEAPAFAAALPKATEVITTTVNITPTATLPGPTATPTSVIPTATPTSVIPTATPTSVIPTETPTKEPTETPTSTPTTPPTSTPTSTTPPPTETPEPTKTPEPTPCIGNPGNAKCVGKSGEVPNGNPSQFNPPPEGPGTKGASDGDKTKPDKGKDSTGTTSKLNDVVAQPVPVPSVQENSNVTIPSGNVTEGGGTEATPVAPLKKPKNNSRP